MTLYEVLGVAPDASQEEIRRAYHRMARLYHPDFHAAAPAAGRAAASDQMREVNEAWSVLGDPSRRATYDRESGLAPDPAAFRPFDESDEPDPRLAPDVPYDPAPPRWRRGMVTLVPVACFGASVVVFSVAAVIRAPVLFGVSVVLLALSGVVFVAVALLALSDARRHG